MAPFFVHQNFLDYLSHEKRFSGHTCTAYRKDLEQFFEFAEILHENDLKEVSSRLVRGWMVDLMDNHYEAVSVNRKLSTLRTYFKWLKREGKIQTNPMSLVKGPKVSKTIPSFVQQGKLQKENIEPLFSDDFDGVRDHLMFEMLYQTGMRLSELIGLQNTDVRPDHIKVLGKRNKERLIPISKELFEQVKAYRIMRQELDEKSPFFFLLNTGKKVYPKFVYRKINNYLGRATDMKKKSPHVLRHTFATQMLNNGAGLEVLKELLGHANLSATQVYTHNSFAKLTSIYSQSHPRGRQK